MMLCLCLVAVLTIQLIDAWQTLEESAAGDSKKHPDSIRFGRLSAMARP